MAIYHKGEKQSNLLHEGKIILQIYRMGKVYLTGWMSSDTKAAIHLAFGEKATQVIKSTNAYLDTIALTDPQRAKQLSGFINEDPLLVCSLVETSKTRWLVNDGTARIKTNILVYPTTKIRIVYLLTSFTSTNKEIIVAGKMWNNVNTTYGVYLNANSKRYFNAGTGLEFGDTVSLNKVYDLQLNASNTYCIINGVRTNGKIAFTGDITDSGAAHYIAGMTQYINIDEHKLVPCQHDNQAGMLDIISGTFYPNSKTSGQFTIQLTDK